MGTCSPDLEQVLELLGITEEHRPENLADYEGLLTPRRYERWEAQADPGGDPLDRLDALASWVVENEELLQEEEALLEAMDSVTAETAPVYTGVILPPGKVVVLGRKPEPAPDIPVPVPVSKHRRRPSVAGFVERLFGPGRWFMGPR